MHVRRAQMTGSLGMSPQQDATLAQLGRCKHNGALSCNAAYRKVLRILKPRMQRPVWSPAPRLVASPTSAPSQLRLPLSEAHFAVDGPLCGAVRLLSLCAACGRQPAQAHWQASCAAFTGQAGAGAARRIKVRERKPGPGFIIRSTSTWMGRRPEQFAAGWFAGGDAEDPWLTADQSWWPASLVHTCPPLRQTPELSAVQIT